MMGPSGIQFCAQSFDHSSEKLKKFSFKRIFANRPNPKGALDDDLYVIKIIRDGRPEGFLINYACHPSILRGSYISADFPGKVGPLLIKAMGKNVAVLYLQGFAGNIRPNLLAPVSSLFVSPKKFFIEFIEGRLFEKNTSEKHINFVGSELVNHIVSIPDDEFMEMVKSSSKGGSGKVIGNSGNNKNSKNNNQKSCLIMNDSDDSD